MVVAVETDEDDFSYGRAEQLFEGPFLGGLAGIFVGRDDYADYDVTSDGQRFVMFPRTGESQGGGGDVTLITNWFEELERLVPTDP